MKSPAAPGYFIETWGCQMNAHDSEKLAGVLEGLGYSAVASPQEADLILLNTCAIREKAAEKVYSELGRLRPLKERNPDLLIGVTGCVASMAGESIFRRAPFIDLVLGPRGIMNLPRLIPAARARRRAVDVTHHPESVLFPWESIRRKDLSKAYVTIVEGCNKSCTYCIVPATRGPEASRALEDILREVEALSRSGCKEIEFLGQTVNAYRDPAGKTLADLLRKSDRIDGVRRLRFTTSHPLHMSADLIDAMTSLEHVVRHLHLPIQSGSDDILRRMKRGYTRRHYLDKIADIRAKAPDMSFSTDIIVGFPGESEGDFAATLELLEEVGFDAVFSFIYSPRPGTAAEDWDDGIEFEEKADRLALLQSRQNEIQRVRNRRWVGRTVEVLVEGPAKRGDGIVAGRIFHGQIVNFPSLSARTGDVIDVVIERAGSNSLKGRAAADIS